MFTETKRFGGNENWTWLVNKSTTKKISAQNETNHFQNFVVKQFICCNLRGATANVLDCGLVVSEFEL